MQLGLLFAKIFSDGHISTNLPLLYCALFMVNQTSLAQLLVQDLRPRGPGSGARGVEAGAQLPPAAAPRPVRGRAGQGGGQRPARGRGGALRRPGAAN